MKTKFIKSLFLMILLSVVGIAQAQTTLYECDFESLSDVDEWEFAHYQYSDNHWCIGTAAHNTTSGTKGLYVSNNNGTTNQYDFNSSAIIYAYHDVTLTPGTYLFSYDWKVKGQITYDEDYTTYSDYFRVALIPSDVEIEANYYSDSIKGASLYYDWYAVDGGEALYNETCTWSNRQQAVTVGTSGTYKLAFIWVNDHYYGGENPPVAIDNVKIMSVSCDSPYDITYNNITENSATIDWTELGSATSWNIEYGVHGFIRGTGTEVTVQQHPYTINGLQANTTYDIYVESVCSGSSVSYAAEGLFNTACADIVLPFYDDFSNVSDRIAPACWNVISGTVYGLSHELLLSDNAVFATPKIFTPINQVGISFEAKLSTGALEIGYVEDLSNMDDFVLLEHIQPMYTMRHRYFFEFDNSDISDNGYLVFRQVNNQVNQYIDDVTIYNLNDCFVPKNVTARTPTDSTILVEWECDQPSSTFQIKYGTTGNIDEYDSMMVTNANSATLTDLQGGPTYHIYVRNVNSTCGEENWQYVYAKLPTECASVINLKVSNLTTTSAMLSWDLTDATLQPRKIVVRYYSDITNMLVDTARNGNFFNLTDLTPNTTYYVSVDPFYIGASGSAQDVEFKTSKTNSNREYRGDNELTNDIPINIDYYISQSIYKMTNLKEEVMNITGITLYSQTMSSNITRKLKVYLANTEMSEFASPYNTLGADVIAPSDYTMVYDGEVTFNQNGSTTISFSEAFHREMGMNLAMMIVDVTGYYNNEYLTFYCHDGSSVFCSSKHQMRVEDIDSYHFSYVNKSPDIKFLGDLSVHNCVSPSVAVARKSNDTIVLAWAPNGNEHSWSVFYRMKGTSTWLMPSYGDVTDTFCAINYLYPATVYEFKVEPNSLFNHSYSYLTAITEGDYSYQLPYYESFDDQYLPYMYLANMNIDNEEYNPYLSNNRLKMPASGVAMLSYCITQLNETQVRFRVKGENETPIYIGVADEFGSVFTTQIVDTLYVDAQCPDDYLVANFDNYPANQDGRHVVLIAGGPISIDDLYVEYKSHCNPPTGLKVLNPGATQSTISWHANENESNWSIIVVPNGTSASSGISVTTSDTMITFNNLTANTLYDAYLSNSCGNTSKITFKTLYADVNELPYSTNFETDQTPYPWQYRTYVGTASWKHGTQFNTPETGEKTLYLVGTNGQYGFDASIDNLAIAYQAIYVDTSDYYTSVLKYKSELDGYNDGKAARVFLIPAKFDMDDLPITYPFNISMGEYNTSEFIPIDGGPIDLGFNQWSTVPLAESVYVPQGYYYLTVLWTNSASSTYYDPLIFDSIAFFHYKCPMPQNITGVNNSGVVQYTWDSPVPVIAWEVMVDDEIQVVYQKAYSYTTVDDSTHTIKIRAVCTDDIYGDWSETYVIPNGCVPITSFNASPMSNTTADISINGGVTSSWELNIYNDEGFDETYYCNGFSYEIQNLQRATYYNVRVRNKCNDILLSPWSDPITFHTFGCYNVSNITATDITDRSATISWDCDGEDQSFEVHVTGSNYDSTYVVDENMITLTDLEGSTFYFVQVKCKCGPDFYGIPESGSFSTLAPVRCQPVTNVQILDVTATTALIDWTPAEDQTRWDVALINDSYTLNLQADTVPFEAQWLSANTDYQVKVRAHCSNGYESEYSEIVTFATSSPCSKPSGVQVSNITERSIDLSFNGGSASSWQVSFTEYGNEYIFDITSTDTTLDVLIPSTDYILKVRSVCSSTSHSTWSAPITFTTLAPNCDPVIDLAVTNITTNTATLSFNASEMQSVWQMRATANDGTPRISEIHSTVVNLVNLNPSTNYSYEVRAVCGIDMFSDWSSPIQFTTEALPIVCDPVSNVTVTNVTETGANISWTAVSEQSQWQLKLTNASGLDTIYEATQTHQLLSNLLSATTYNVSIRAVCAGGAMHSEWSTPVSFTTLSPSSPSCEPIGTLYVNSYDMHDATIAWNIVEGQTQWMIEFKQVGGESVLYTTSENTYHFTNLYSGTTYEVRVRTICDENVYSEWCDPVQFTTTGNPPCFPVSNIQASNITTNSATITWDAVAGQSHWKILKINGIMVTEYESFETSYELTGLSANNEYTINVYAICGEGIESEGCDIPLTFTTAAEECNPVSNLTVTNISENSASVSWTAPVDQYSWQMHIVGGSTDAILDAYQSSTSINNLLEATSYTISVRAVCGRDNYSEWCESVSFTTLGGDVPTECDPVTNVSVQNITANSATVTWNAVEGQSQWQVRLIHEGSEVLYIANETNILLSDLQANSNYSVAVRALCSEDNISDWSSDVDFQTTNDPTGIDGIDGYANILIYPNPTSGATSIILKGVEGVVAISIVDMNGRTMITDSWNVVVIVKNVLT